MKSQVFEEQVQVSGHESVSSLKSLRVLQGDIVNDLHFVWCGKCFMAGPIFYSDKTPFDPLVIFLSLNKARGRDKQHRSRRCRLGTCSFLHSAFAACMCLQYIKSQSVLQSQVKFRFCLHDVNVTQVKIPE